MQGRAKTFLVSAIACICLIAVLITAYVFQASTVEPGPNYQGKSLSYWIQRPSIVESHGGSDFGEFGYLPKVDSNAIPYISKALRRHNNAFSERYTKLWLDLPVTVSKHLPYPLDYDYGRASLTEAIGNMGTGGEPFIPDLIRELQTDDSPFVKTLAATALGRVGGDNFAVISCLSNALGDSSVAVREKASNALAQISRHR